MNGLNTTCAQSGRCGNGDFAPFGIEGIIKGTAKCFYAYIGILHFIITNLINFFYTQNLI